MQTHKIVFTGSGGQGLISAAIILGEAAVMHEDLEAVQSQAYGGSCNSEETQAFFAVERRLIWKAIDTVLDKERNKWQDQ